MQRCAGMKVREWHEDGFAILHGAAGIVVLVDVFLHICGGGCSV